MELDCTNKVALVTGAANGIGAGVARRLRSCGAQVVLADIDSAAGLRLADELGASFFEIDVRDLASNRAMVAHAVSTYGGLDIVHLNAGVGAGMSLGVDFDLDTYRRIMGINLDGVVFGIHCALPALIDRGGGDIVATASMAGLTPAPFDPLYAANKAAVVGLVRSLAGYQAEHQIRVNALCPSFAETAIIEKIRPLLEANAFPILDVDAVVDALWGVLEGDRSGECWYVVPGRPSEPFRFRNVPGPRS